MSFIGSKCKNVKLAQILSVTLKLVRLVVYGNREEYVNCCKKKRFCEEKQKLKVTKLSPESKGIVTLLV